jgi:hypothetical protein
MRSMTKRKKRKKRKMVDCEENGANEGTVNNLTSLLSYFEEKKFPHGW